MSWEVGTKNSNVEGRSCEVRIKSQKLRARRRELAAERWELGFQSERLQLGIGI